MYMVDEFIKCFSAGKAFGSKTKYHAHSKLVKDVEWL